MESKQIDVLKTSFRKMDESPDPADIGTAGKWYLLNHLSTPLIEFDHKRSAFNPLIAKSWEIDGSRYIFHIDPDAKFNDGSRIRPYDVAMTLKRILALKKSTHFPLWKHVTGCEDLSNLESECSGLRWDDAKGLVEIELRAKSDSFLLQISSPEAGIWSGADIDKISMTLKPSRFSGPYFLKNLKVDENHNLILYRNEHSPIQLKFPNSPRTILVKSMERDELENQIARGEQDVFIGDFIPYNDHDWEKLNFGVHFTTPSSIIYFFGLNSDKRIGRDLLEALAKIPEKRIAAAKTFLPFSPEVALSEGEVATAVPEKSSQHIRVAVPRFYIKQGTVDFFKSAAREVDVDLELIDIGKEELISLLKTKEDFHGKYDFVLGNYVASERYPAVQLRYLTRSRTAPIDLSDVEQPDQDPEKIRRLKEYQKWLLSSQTVVPIYFLRTHIVSSPLIDIGDQPTTDADIQLWRFTRKGR